MAKRRRELIEGPSAPGKFASEDLFSNLHLAPQSGSPEFTSLATPTPRLSEFKEHAALCRNGISYCSLSEAVYAAFLERYVEGFRIVTGVTYQLPLSDGRTVDFRIGNLLFEFHGVRLKAGRSGRGDFGSLGEFRSLRADLRASRGDRFRRTRVFHRARSQIAQQYYLRRKALIDRSPGLRGMELVVATSMEEFYERVLARVSSREIPPFAEYAEEYGVKVRELARARAA